MFIPSNFDQLVKAVEKGDIHRVERLTARGVDLNQADAQGDTPLIKAVKTQHPEIMSFLLQSGANPHVQNKLEQSPLSLAMDTEQLGVLIALLSQLSEKPISSIEGDIQRIWNLFADHKDLLNQQLQQYIQQEFKDQPELTLIELIPQGNTEYIKNLVSQNPQLLSEKDLYGLTPLHIAVQAQDPELVKFFLDQGSRPNEADAQGRTPLYYALKNANIEIIEILYDFGALFTKADEDGKTPLDLLARYPDDDLVERFWPRLKDKLSYEEMKKFYNEALGYANPESLLPVERTLTGLEVPGTAQTSGKPARALTGQGDFAADTPALRRSAVMKPSDVLQSMKDGDSQNLINYLDQKGDANILDKNGSNLLHLMAGKPYDKKVIRLLIHRGINVNARNRFGQTPLMLAAARNNIPLLKLLLKFEAKVNETNLSKQTALMYAAYHNHSEIVRLLLKAGANPRIIDKYGNTALIWAHLQKSKKAESILRLH